MKKCFIGIDPGSVGACVGITEDGDIHEIRFGKVTDADIYKFMEMLSFSYQCFCIKEKVWAIPAKNDDGSFRSMGASTSFTFGENNGKIIGFLVASGISYEEKTPQTWQKLYGLKKEKNESQPDYKKRLRQRAEQLFPKQKITTDNADAYLIAEFTRRTRTNG
jgi:hypothetical protein